MGEITNVTRPEQEYKFRDVPLPYPLTYLYPKAVVSYATNPVAMTVKAITGKSLYPVCTMVGKHITTFDNRTTKINVLFDGKNVKLEGSNLLKNKLCGLCGDSNNKMVGEVPSPRQCLLSSPKLEVASYRVSLSSKQCGPLPGSIEAELEKETEMCIKLSNHRTMDHYSSSSIP